MNLINEQGKLHPLTGQGDFFSIKKNLSRTQMVFGL